MICCRCGQLLPAPSHSWSLELNYDVPTQNKIASNKGGGRFAYKQIRDAFFVLVRSAATAQRIPRATSQRRVIITRNYAGKAKERDWGNLVGGCKPLLDALVLSGLLVGDAPHQVEDHYFQKRVTGQTFITVIVSEP